MPRTLDSIFLPPFAIIAFILREENDFAALTKVTCKKIHFSSLVKSMKNPVARYSRKYSKPTLCGKLHPNPFVTKLYNHRSIQE